MPRGNFKVLRCQTRKMVFNVLQFMKKEAKEGRQIGLHATLKRTSAATGVSMRTIGRIAKKVRESSNSLLVAFKTPGNNRRRRVKTVTGISNFDQGYIKRRIHNYHITEKQLPTVNQLLSKLKNEIGFEGCATSIRRVIKDLGFKWTRTKGDKKVLIEHTNIRLKRIEYLEKLTKFRAEGRPIIFTDESYVDSSQITPKAWSDKTTEGLKPNTSKAQRIVIINAGSEVEFIPNTLSMFTTESKIGDFMTYDNYENWLRAHLIPNLPEKSVVVVDNARYHKKLENTAPSSNASRSVMETWLMDNDIPHSSTMLKPELYKLIYLHKKKFKKYDIDRILKENGHDVLRLPPYHPDLNPMELAWPAIKVYVAENVAVWNVNKVIKLVEDKIDEMSSQEWGMLCQKVKEIAENYKRSDLVIDQLTEELTIYVSDDESSISEEEEDFPDSDSSSDESASSSGI